MNILPVFIIGKGNIGSALLSQMAAAAPRLAAAGLELRVIGLADRSASLLSSGGLDSGDLAALAADRGLLADRAGAVAHAGWPELMSRIDKATPAGAVVVDVTAEPAAEQHLAWLASGRHVVTANKKPLTSGQADYDRLSRFVFRHDGPHYRFETAVGAGLPVIGTLLDLLATGDEVLEAGCAVSGTLGFIFSACEEGRPFAEAVAEAKGLGYTEPDPRDDLSGMDVARKGLILGRLIGLRAELDSLSVETLVPEELSSCPAGEFLSRLPEHGAAIDARFSAARERGQTLRYLAKIVPGGIRVGLEEVPLGAGFGSLSGPENMFVFRTRRYDAAPLTVRGPGAGAAVTAAGVFADVLRVAESRH